MNDILPDLQYMQVSDAGKTETMLSQLIRLHQPQEAQLMDTSFNRICL